MITWLWLVEAETSCGLSLKGSYVFLSSLAMPQTPAREETRCLKPGLSHSAQMTCLVHPLFFFPSLSTFQHEKFHSQNLRTLSIPSERDFISHLNDWSCEGKSRSKVNALPRAASCMVVSKKSIPALLQCPFLCHIKVSPSREIRIL